MSTKSAACLMAIVVAAMLVGCGEAPSTVRTVASPVIPFRKLFQLEDTIRLNPAILVGHIGFMDVDENGALLITDDVARTVHKFSAAGEFVRRYDVAECLPDDAGIFPLVARTMPGGRVLVALASTSVAIFGADGACMASRRALKPFAKSYCIQGDSIVIHNRYTAEQPKASIFTSALTALPGVNIAPPRFVVLDYTYAGQQGRTIECFRDGPYYIYNESLDATPVGRKDSTIRYRPAFFNERKEDLQIGSFAARDKARSKHTNAMGVFALDGQTRLVAYVDLDSEWNHEYAEVPIKVGISVASNTGAFPGRSTVSPVWPIAAANGYLYTYGENEQLPDGDVGNPLVVRYRFTAPTE